MTWSIVARSRSGAFGVAVASRFFAVGALCSHAHSGIGALATQALMNPLYGARGLSMLSQGLSSTDVVEALIENDAGRNHRPGPPKLALMQARSRDARRLRRQSQRRSQTDACKSRQSPQCTLPCVDGLSG